MVGCRVTLKRDRKLVSLSLNAMFKLQIPMLFSCSRGESPPSHSKLQDEIISSVVGRSTTRTGQDKSTQVESLARERQTQASGTAHPGECKGGHVQPGMKQA